VSAGGYGITIAIKTDGTVWGWGCNSAGQVGIGNTVNRSSPVQEICSASNWCDVIATHCAFHGLKTDGTMWGAGAFFGHWDGTTGGRCSPVQEASSSTNWCHIGESGGRFSQAIKTDGTLWGVGLYCFGSLGLGNSCASNVSSPVQEITSSTNWCFVSTGFSHSMDIKSVSL
jgi:alpha-tubulin suppressor-like RCC1 family protein